MGWTWQYETAQGVIVSELPHVSEAITFPNQADAETWIGEMWRSLLESGVDQVTLLEDERIVYGPMNLNPE